MKTTQGGRSPPCSWPRCWHSLGLRGRQRVGSDDEPTTTTTATHSTGDGAGRRRGRSTSTPPIEASRDEGTLVVYGNPSADQWEPVLEAFGEAYPWIEVETFDLGGAEAFQRYLSEEATGRRHRRRDREHRRRRLARPGRAGPGRRLRRPRAGRPARRSRSLAPGVFAMSLRPARSACSTPRRCPRTSSPTTLAELADDGRGARRQDRHRRRRERPGRPGHLRLRRRPRRGRLGGARAARPAHQGRGRAPVPCSASSRAASTSPASSPRARSGRSSTPPRPATSSTTATSPTPRRCRPGAWASRPRPTRPTRPRCSSTSCSREEGQTAACAGGLHALPRRRRLPAGPGRRSRTAVGDGERHRRRLPAGARRPSRRRSASAGTRRSADDRDRHRRPLDRPPAGGRLRRSWLPGRGRRSTCCGPAALVLVVGPIIPVVWASLWSTPLYEAGGALTLGQLPRPAHRPGVVGGRAQQRRVRRPDHGRVGGAGHGAGRPVRPHRPARARGCFRGVLLLPVAAARAWRSSSAGPRCTPRRAT